MSSGHPSATYHQQDGSGFQKSTGDTAAMVSMHPDVLDLEQFMMDHDANSRHGALATPSHLDVLHHDQQFADYTFPYSNIMENVLHGEHQIGNTSDPYNMSGHSAATPHRSSITSMPGDHRNSITSMSGDHRLSITSVSAPRPNMGNPSAQVRHFSVSGGSDEPSPSSNRHQGTGYSDDFGLMGGGGVDGSDMGSRPKEDKNEAAPAWTEMKTKAGKERKRLPLACIACRRKKIRCSGEKPACKHCIRSRIPCVYKVTTRKAAPRTDYMAMLDKRLKRMEERIIKIVPIDEQASTTASVARANVKPAIPGTTSPNTGKKRAAEEAFGTNLDDWSKSTAGSQIDTAKPPSLLIQEAEESKLLAEGEECLPTKDLQEHLAEVFFAHIYGQTYHLLHKPSYMRKLRSGTLPPVLVLAVCAVSARFSTHPKLNSQPAFLRGEEWASKAREIVMRRYEWPNITILTCLLILGMHEFGTCHGGRSWSLCGQAIRMAYALQLHQDLDYDPQKRNGTVELSFIDREIRRRTMWSCFLMDRFNSSGTDRPTFIKEETIKVQLPIREKFFQLDMPGPTEDLGGNVPHAISPGAGQLSDAKDNMGVAAYMIRAIALWGRIINYLNLGGSDQDPLPKWHPESQYADLIKQTEEFDGTLPESLKYNVENLRSHQTEGLDNQYLFLHISAQQNILFMNRFAVPDQPGGRPPKDIPKEYVTKAGTKAFRAANKISEILHASSSHFITAPFAGYCAFLSSTVHVFGVFSKNPAMEQICKRNLAINVTYITKMKKYWGMFHWMAENLKEQYRVCADVARKGPGAAGADNSSGSIFQYGDWFDRYPHGVSQADFDDPLKGAKKEQGDDAVLEQKSDYATVEEFFNTLPPIPPRSLDAGKATKQKGAKKARSEQHPSEPESVDTNLPPSSQPLHIPNQGLHYQQHPQHSYNELSPTTPSVVDMYHHHSSHSVATPNPAHFLSPPASSFAPAPQQMNLMPQLDRQLVFNSYANMDPSSLSSQSILDSVNAWDASAAMGLGGQGLGAHLMNGGMGGEVTSAWFMPFNMVPPDINGGNGGSGDSGIGDFGGGFVGYGGGGDQ